MRDHHMRSAWPSVSRCAPIGGSPVQDQRPDGADRRILWACAGSRNRRRLGGLAANDGAFKAVNGRVPASYDQPGDWLERGPEGRGHPSRSSRTRRSGSCLDSCRTCRERARLFGRRPDPLASCRGACRPNRPRPEHAGLFRSAGSGCPVLRGRLRRAPDADEAGVCRRPASWPHGPGRRRHCGSITGRWSAAPQRDDFDRPSACRPIGLRSASHSRHGRNRVAIVRFTGLPRILRAALIHGAKAGRGRRDDAERPCCRRLGPSCPRAKGYGCRTVGGRNG